MTPADFDYIRYFVLAEAGIVLEPGKEYLVESRLHTLACKEQFPSLDHLIQRLRSSPQNGLHRKVVDAMTTNETSFFRDLHPFDALQTQILPEIIARRGPDRQLHLWCGAASTGQEPFSVLMIIADHFPELLKWDLKFVATDLCSGALARARRGRFNQLEINRGLPAALLVRHFARDGAEWEFRADLRQRVDFRELNLIKEWPSMPLLDVVFLRNVLIYFGVEAKKKIFSKIRRLLRPGGCLLLGGAETTLNVDESFERVPMGKTSCYRLKQA